MSARADEHTMRVGIEDGLVWLRVVCPYDPDDALALVRALLPYVRAVRRQPEPEGPG